MNRRDFMLMIAVALLSARAQGETDPMTTAVRGSLAAGAQYLLSSIHETNGWNYVFDPPSVPHGAVYVRTVTNYYSYKTVTVPVVLYENRTVYYERYETMEQKPSNSPGEPPNPVKVTKLRRINSPADATNPRYVEKRTERVMVKQTDKTEEQKRLVGDPNGSIQQVTTIQRPGTADFWSAGFLGQQAMALLVLRKCGVAEDHEKLGTIADTLTAAVMGYGAPDTTWDLAWMAAAYAHLENKRHREARDIVFNKLLDGQILDGRARGLWGPLCINAEVLGRLMERQQAVMQKTGGKVGENMDGVVEAEFLELGKSCRAVAQQGLRFLDMLEWYELGLNDWNRAGIDVITEGLPYYIYNETFADLESTAVALYALREIRQQKLLPAQTTRPNIKGAARMGAWPRPERTDAILARCAAALAKLQARDGGWPAANIQQPAPPVKELMIARIPVQPAPKLSNEQTHVSVMRGVSALFRVGDVAGMDKLLGQYRQNVATAYQVRRKLAEQCRAGQVDLDPPPYCHFLPEEFIFNFSGLQRFVNSSEERDRGLWQDLARWLMERQRQSGDWPMPFAKYAVKTTSIWGQLPTRERARIKALNAERLDRAANATLIEPFPEDDVAFYPEWLRRAAASKSPHAIESATWPPKERPVLLEDGVATTCLAMLYLLDGLRPPPLGYMATNAMAGPPPLLGAVAGKLARTDSRTVSLLRVGEEHDQMVQGAPILFASSLAFLDDSKQSSAVQRSLACGATLVVEGSFVPTSTAARLAPLVVGGKAGQVPDDAPWMKEWSGNRPRIEAVLRGDGSVAVVLLPWTTGVPSDGLLASSQAQQAAYLLARHRVTELANGTMFDVDPEKASNPMAMRDAALNQMESATRKPAVAPAPPGSGTGSKSQPPASGPDLSPSPPPKADEVW